MKTTHHLVTNLPWNFHCQVCWTWLEARITNHSLGNDRLFPIIINLVDDSVTFHDQTNSVRCEKKSWTSKWMFNSIDKFFHFSLLSKKSVWLKRQSWYLTSGIDHYHCEEEKEREREKKWMIIPYYYILRLSIGIVDTWVMDEAVLQNIFLVQRKVLERNDHLLA